jgi:hypothetical protein
MLGIRLSVPLTGTTRQTRSSLELDLDPIDWQQMELLAQLSPAQRTLAMMRAAEFVRAGLRAAFHRRYPELSDAEVNMKVLAYLTPVRGFEP